MIEIFVINHNHFQIIILKNHLYERSLLSISFLGFAIIVIFFLLLLYVGCLVN